MYIKPFWQHYYAFSTVPSYYRNHQAKFKINRIILTCLTDGCTDPNYRKALLIKKTRM